MPGGFGLAAKPGEGAPLGNHDTATAIFKKAIERGNLVVAEVTTLEIGRIDLPADPFVAHAHPCHALGAADTRTPLARSGVKNVD
jgi:hypothetical protein